MVRGVGDANDTLRTVRDSKKQEKKQRTEVTGDRGEEVLRLWTAKIWACGAAGLLSASRLLEHGLAPSAPPGIRKRGRRQLRRGRRGFTCKTVICKPGTCKAVSSAWPVSQVPVGGDGPAAAEAVPIIGFIGGVNTAVLTRPWAREPDTPGLGRIGWLTVIISIWRSGLATGVHAAGEAGYHTHRPAFEPRGFSGSATFYAEANELLAHAGNADQPRPAR